MCVIYLISVFFFKYRPVIPNMVFAISVNVVAMVYPVESQSTTLNLQFLGCTLIVRAVPEGTGIR